jgi:dTDP-4-amino-4,6-dideoxygalactose transaminase
MKEIRLSKSVIGQEEIDAVTDVLKRGYLGMGVDVDLFEKKLCTFFQREVTCVNTGTAALHLAMQALGLGVGDEILVQSLTYVSNFQAISATGATPVACEVNNNTLTIDLTDAKKKLTNKTKAISPVHYAGNTGDLDAIYSFAKEHGLRVIEDASHAFGTIYKDKLIGSFGDICCISLDGIKNITSGEGGIIISNDPIINQRVKDARLVGVEKDTDNRYKGLRSWDFDVKLQGWRFHMSNIMAAIGLVQFEKFPEFKKRRQHLAKMYNNELKGFVELIDCDYSLVVPHIFVIRVDNNKRDIIRDELAKIGISTGIHYKPNHQLSYFADHQDNSTLVNTDTIYSRLITLPLHPEITDEQVMRICNRVKELV